MTSKEYVLQQFPDAKLVNLHYGKWGIVVEIEGSEVLIGEGSPSAKAWDNAAEEIKYYLKCVYTDKNN